ncbi:hypothetical protein D3C80_2071760 [compost metagenome]
MVAIGAQLLDRVGHVALDLRDAGFGIPSVSADKCLNQIDFAGKMMVDTRFTTTDDVGNIRIAETIVAA